MLSPHKPLLNVISAQSLGKLPQFTEQNLANLAWAFAKLALADWPLLNAVSDAALGKVSELYPQALANFAWVCATLAWKNTRLLRAIAAQSIEVMPEFGEQNISNLVWALATLSDFHDGHSASAAVLQKVEGFPVQELVNTGLAWRACIRWALGKLAYCQPAVVHALSSAAVRKYDEYRARDLTNTAW
eukprot:469515-Amphidinium_carterae.1